MRTPTAIILACAGITLARDPQPNLMVILADDMGYSDLGCYGSEIQTPNLDRLAQNGIRFTHFYNAARCCPTRASLLTGLYPHQAGIGGMTYDNNPSIRAYQGWLTADSATLGEAMKQNGYYTFMSGKWHVGNNDPSMWPSGRGFEHAFALLGGAASYYTAQWKKDGPQLKMELNGDPYTITDPDFYMTEAITDYTLDFLKQCPANKPFFAYVAYTAPHWPLHAREKDIAKYRGCYDEGWDVLREKRYERMKQIGLIDDSFVLARRSDGDGVVPPWAELSDQQKKEMAQRMEIYAAQIDCLDQQIGRILDDLKTAGRDKNTLILFLSDNGCSAEPMDTACGKQYWKPTGRLGGPGTFYSCGRGWAEVSNVPFRLWKQKIHEGGVHTPLIAYWPQGISVPENTMERNPGHIIDIMATCVDLAGGKYPETAPPMEGLSLANAFRGQPRPLHDIIAWEHYANRGILHDHWKLVAQRVGQEPGPWELYDMDKDPCESRDLSARHAETVKELSELYRQWANRVGVIEIPRNWKKKNH